MICTMWGLSLQADLSRRDIDSFQVENLINNWEYTWHGTGPDLVNNAFLPTAFQASIKYIKSPHLQSGNHELANKEGILPLFIGLGDLRVPACSGTSRVLTLTYCLKRRLSKDVHVGCSCRGRIGPLACEASSDYFSGAGANLILTDNTVFNVNTN